jgi:hypothetical protein
MPEDSAHIVRVPLQRDHRRRPPPPRDRELLLLLCPRELAERWDLPLE